MCQVFSRCVLPRKAGRRIISIAGEEWEIPGSPVHNEQRWYVSLTPTVPYKDPWSESCGTSNATHSVVFSVTFLGERIPEGASRGGKASIAPVFTPALSV